MRAIARALILTVLLSAAWSAAGCGTVEETTSKPTAVPFKPPRVIARVNGEAVLEDEFRAFIAFLQADLHEDTHSLPLEALFHEFLSQELLLQEATKDQLQVPQDEIDYYLAQWTVDLDEVSEDVQHSVHDFLLTQKLLARRIRSELSVSLHEMQMYYEEHEEDYVVGDQAHVLEILSGSRSEAEAIRAMIPEGDVRSFRELASTHSTGLTAESGGDLGFFERGELPEEFEKAIFALRPGEISQPFQSGHGFHLFLLEEWIPRHPQKFHEVRQEIFQHLMAEKERAAVSAYLNQLMEAATIEIYEPNLARKPGGKDVQSKESETYVQG
jgi:parvulin-like peptidyl-prolyl isomerase